jgi:hypothetical protein
MISDIRKCTTFSNTIRNSEGGSLQKPSKAGAFDGKKT